IGVVVLAVLTVPTAISAAEKLSATGWVWAILASAAPVTLRPMRLISTASAILGGVLKAPRLCGVTSPSTSRAMPGRVRMVALPDLLLAVGQDAEATTASAWA